jgi:hypothetical protein
MVWYHVPQGFKIQIHQPKYTLNLTTKFPNLDCTQPHGHACYLTLQDLDITFKTPIGTTQG